MPLTIAVDFDGTCVRDAFPNIGKEIFGAVIALKKMVADGHKLILWTCREHSAYKGVADTLQLALDWFEKKEIPLYAVNGNPMMYDYPVCRKCHADLVIDDHAVGIPKTGDGDPDWFLIYNLVKQEELRLSHVSSK